MKLLVIGGTGVLSTAVVAEALRKGVEVTMINRGHRMERIPQGVKFIKADCSDTDTIETALSGCVFDAVIDFICYERGQVEHSLNLYSKHACQYFFISSAAVLDTRVKGVLDEESPKVLPSWDYSVQKWDAEIFVQKECARKGIHYTIVRPAITYDDTRIPYGFAPRYGYHWTFVERAKVGKPIVTWNKGANRCNMIRVEDFAVGVIGLIANEKAYDEAFIICGDEAPSFIDVVHSLEKSSSCIIPTIDIDVAFIESSLPGRKGEMEGRSHDMVLSNAKIKAVVPDFKQSITLDEGVQKTVSAYQNYNYQKGIDWVYDAQCDYLIKKWCKKNKIDRKPSHLGFVNYLGTASLKDKMLYYSIYFQDLTFMKLAKRIKKMF